MLWQDQSYASIRRFRTHSTAGWCDFHTARFEMLVGEFLLVYNWSLLSFGVRVMNFL
jgi:hypothetical protein